MLDISSADLPHTGTAFKVTKASYILQGDISLSFLFFNHRIFFIYSFFGEDVIAIITFSFKTESLKLIIIF